MSPLVSLFLSLSLSLSLSIYMSPYVSGFYLSSLCVLFTGNCMRFSPHSLCSPTAWHCSFGPPLPSSTVVTGVVLICFILSTYYSIYIYICSTCISYWIHVLPWEDTPETKADILYIYTERERKDTERRRDTETNIAGGKGLHHILAIM